MAKIAGKSVYEIVTERVMASLEAGTMPWRKPWNAGSIRPCNAESGREYSGGNYFLMSMLPFAMPAFLTFNQIKKSGATIKPGEEKKHFPVFYWKWLEKINDKGQKESIPMLRYFLVWNIEQVDGFKLPAKLTKNSPESFNHDPIESAQAIVDGYQNGPEIVVARTDRACYYPTLDKVNVPEIGQYSDPQAYYSTMFHELGHSTGHSSRLNRKELMDANAFGSHDYSQEEMVAELCAAFLCAESGIDNTLDNSAAYIAGWMRKLQDDPKLFWTAAGRAQKAADHILGRSPADKVEAV